MDRFQVMQVFVRVVETGSFSKAALELGTTQPTATKAVAEAERHLGARLLHRSTRGVTPTEAGALYHERCKAILRALEDAENLTGLVQEGATGTLRINSSVAFGRRVLTPLVLRYMAEHPRLQIDLGFDARYVDLVEHGVDVAIRIGRLADSGLGARHLGINPWVLTAAPAYLAARGRPAAPADLSAHACLIYSSVQGDARWLLHAPGGADESVPVRGPLRTNNLSTILAANPNLAGVYGVNDSMALGAVDVAKEKGLIGKMVIFGNDGEKDALASIEAGELTGTQYTDVFQQGRFAAAAATVLTSGLVTAKAFEQQGKLLMPFVIATKDTVGQIQPSQRW